MRRLLALWLVLFAGGCGRHVVTQCSSTARPPARTDFTAVRVPATDHLFVFGGRAPLAAVAALWRWGFGACAGWLHLPFETTPGPRAGYAADFDDRRHRILYVGGAQANDVWALDTDRLAFEQLLAVGSAPVPAGAEVAAYDHDRDRLIVVGAGTFALDFSGSPDGLWRGLAADSAGLGAAAAVDPTRSLLLVWDDAGLRGFAFLTSTWRTLALSGALPPVPARLVWDGNRSRLLAVTGAVFAATLDGNGEAADFVRVATTGDPPPRAGFGVGISGDLLWLFGGSDGACVYDDVWTLDLNTGAWTNVEPATSCP
jgi:hypothetical protein